MHPDISIIVYAAGDPDVLFRCVESLLNQTFPLDKTELIIAGHNPDRKLEQALRAGDCNRFLSLKYVSAKLKGAAAARNRAIQDSSSEIIAFLDDDYVADCDWVKWIIEAHRNNPDKPVIAGLTYVSECENTSLVSQFLGCGIMYLALNSREIIPLSASNVSVKKRIFSKYQFDEHFLFPFGEGLDFFGRLVKGGEKVILEQNIRAVRSPAGLTSFLKQAYYSGRGSLLTAYLHKDGGFPPKDLKTGSISFWLSSLFNFIKIPVFGYSSGRRLIRQEAIKPLSRKVLIYFLCALYRILYLFGNIREFFRFSSIAGRWARRPA